MRRRLILVSAVTAAALTGGLPALGTAAPATAAGRSFGSVIGN